MFGFDNDEILQAQDIFNKSTFFKAYSLVNDQITGIKEHSHNYIQIWYVMKGCIIHQVNHVNHVLTKGNIFVLPPFITHKIEILECEETKVLGFEFLSSFVNENLTNISRNNALFDFTYLEPYLLSIDKVKPKLFLSGITQARVESLFEDMLNEYQNQEIYYELSIKADLLKLLFVISRELEKTRSDDQNELFCKYRIAIKLAVDFINNNYTSKLCIDDVCKISMLSQTYFSTLFKQLTNNTFIEYLNNLRIKKATELLVNSNNSITDISYSTGFNDSNYFQKVFKQKTGLSPKDYRKMSIGTYSSDQ